MQLEIRSEKDFEKLTKALADDLVTANIHFKLYRDLNNAVNKYVRELNQSSAFWSATFLSHLEVTLFRLCRIYDQNKKSLSLKNWLDTIKANLKIFDVPNFKARLKNDPFVNSLALHVKKPPEKSLEEDIRLTSGNDHLVKKLVKLRMNLYAHKSAKNVMNEKDLLKTYPLTLNDINILLKRGVRILNMYSNLFNANIYSTQIVGHDDYLYVLNAVKSDLEQQDAKMETELKKYQGK